MKLFFLIFTFISLSTFGFSQSLNPEDDVDFGWSSQSNLGITLKVKDFTIIENVQEKDFAGKYFCFWQNTDSLNIYYRKGKLIAEYSGIDSNQQWKEILKNFKIVDKSFQAKKFYGKLVSINSKEYGIMYGILMSLKLDDGEVYRTFFKKIK